jgi:hypothetical protein
MRYTGFGCGSPLPLLGNIQPSSKLNMFFGKSDTIEISSAYTDTGSEVISFGVKSIASGCFEAASNGAIATAVSCTICYTGVKATPGPDVVFDAKFRIVGKLSLLNIPLDLEPLQTKDFPSGFNDLRSLKIERLTSDLPIAINGRPPIGRVGMAFDDIVQTVLVKT